MGELNEKPQQVAQQSDSEMFLPWQNASRDAYSQSNPRQAQSANPFFPARNEPPNYQDRAPMPQDRIPIPSPFFPNGAFNAPKDRTPNRDETARAMANASKLYERGDVRGAAQQFKIAARGNDAGAQLQLGLMYEKGIGVEQDSQEAAAYYFDAAKQGHPQAMKNLGQMYEFGNGVQEDWEEAAIWYQRGAEKGNVSAQAALARAYQFGIGVPQDRGESIRWSRQAMMNGDRGSEEWVRKLSSPTNFIGFRTEEERDLVMGNKLRTASGMLGGDPEGITFRNEGERLQWLRQFAAGLDAEEGQRNQRQQQPFRSDYYGSGTGRVRE